MAFLTDRTLATGVTLQDLIHIVITGDTSQNPAGSSYKATVQQVSDAILDGFTGSTDYYVTGGTYSGGTLVLDRQNGSVTITGFTTGSTQLYEVGSGTNSTQRIGVSSNTSGNYSVVSGGIQNTASCNYSFVGGGSGNTASNLYSFVGGGQLNSASGIHSVVGGGQENKATSFCNFVGGGGQNTALGFRTTIAGGRQNTTSSTYSIIGGGWCNKAICAESTIGGGRCNSAFGNGSSILGGLTNTVFCNYGTILGGSGNTINHELSAAYGKDIVSKSANTFHINYLALNDTQILDQSLTDYLVRDSATGIVKYKTFQPSYINTTSISTSTYTASTNFTYYGVVYSGDTDIQIPNPTSLDGFNFKIKDERGTAGTYRIRVTPIVGLIDGNTYIDMNINYMSLTFVARNNNWWII